MGGWIGPDKGAGRYKPGERCVKCDAMEIVHEGESFHMMCEDEGAG
jgi:hypothetical protein